MSAFRSAALRFRATPLTTVSSFRPLSTSVVRPSVVDTAKQVAEAASKTAGNVLLKGINAGEKISESVGATSEQTANKAEDVKQKTAETARDMQNTSGDQIAGKAQGAASEYSGKAKGAANEYSGKAQGTINEYAGKAKGTANEYAGKAKRVANETVEEVKQETGFTGTSNKAKTRVNTIEGDKDRVGRPGY